MTWNHDQVAISLQGTQVDLFPTVTSGQLIIKTYPVTVTNGRLSLRIQDLGGADPFAVVIGMEVISR